MKQKWFKLVGEDGNALSSADAVSVDIEDVAAFRDAVFSKVDRALPANVISSDLKVFANRTAYGAKQEVPSSSSPVTDLGKDEDNAIIVQAAGRVDSQPHYFIFPDVREHVTNSVFQIVKAGARIGIGAFFSPNLAVTCDRNLTNKHTEGSLVSVRLKEGMVSVQVVARNPDLDFAILKSSQPKSFIPPWNGSPDDLQSRDDLVLASFRLGIDEYREEFKNKLGFVKALCISRFKSHVMYSCPTYAGDSCHEEWNSRWHPPGYNPCTPPAD